MAGELRGQKLYFLNLRAGLDFFMTQPVSRSGICLDRNRMRFGSCMRPLISVTPSPVFWGYLIRVMGFHIEVPGTAIAFEDRIGDHWD